MNTNTPHRLKRARLPGAGAEAYVYQRHFADPIEDIWGRSTPAGHLNVFGPPPAIVNLAVTVTGFNGIVAGQYALQPVTNPDNETGSI